MMCRILTNSIGHNMPSRRIPSVNKFIFEACAKGKFIVRPSRTKVGIESSIFLERIHGDIYGPIHPTSGPFQYFMVLIDASTRWTHVCLLSTRNNAFAKFITKHIKLRVQFPNYPIKSIRTDNVGEFTSKAFDDYCMALGIKVKHPVPYVHTHNGLAKCMIKPIKLIARSFLQHSDLPISCWRHVILHVVALIQIWPTAYHDYSPLQIVRGKEPNISHLRIIECLVYVPISRPHCNSMGP